MRPCVFKIRFAKITGHVLPQCASICQLCEKNVTHRNIGERVSTPANGCEQMQTMRSMHTRFSYSVRSIVRRSSAEWRRGRNYHWQRSRDFSHIATFRSVRVRVRSIVLRRSGAFLYPHHTDVSDSNRIIAPHALQQPIKQMHIYILKYHNTMGATDWEDLTVATELRDIEQCAPNASINNNNTCCVCYAFNLCMFWHHLMRSWIVGYDLILFTHNVEVESVKEITITSIWVFTTLGSATTKSRSIKHILFECPEYSQTVGCRYT